MSIEKISSTALGPAVLTSVALACKGNPGSTVVICTDSLSNTGLGAYDEAKTHAQTDKVNEFYESWSNRKDARSDNQPRLDCLR